MHKFISAAWRENKRDVLGIRRLYLLSGGKTREMFLVFEGYICCLAGEQERCSWYSKAISAVVRENKRDVLGIRRLYLLSGGRTREMFLVFEGYICCLAGEQERCSWYSKAISAVWRENKRDVLSI